MFPNLSNLFPFPHFLPGLPGDLLGRRISCRCQSRDFIVFARKTAWSAPWRKKEGDITNFETHFWKMYVVIPPPPSKLITPLCYVFIGTFAWKFHVWNICPCRQAARKITPQHGTIFLAACLEGQIFHAWNFHVKVRIHWNFYVEVPCMEYLSLQASSKKDYSTHGVIFLAACPEGQMYHAWKFHKKVPMNIHTLIDTTVYFLAAL